MALPSRTWLSLILMIVLSHPHLHTHTHPSSHCLCPPCTELEKEELKIEAKQAEIAIKEKQLQALRGNAKP
jgi:hypothetical protein